MPVWAAQLLEKATPHKRCSKKQIGSDCLHQSAIMCVASERSPICENPNNGRSPIFGCCCCNLEDKYGSAGCSRRTPVSSGRRPAEPYSRADHSEQFGPIFCPTKCEPFRGIAKGSQLFSEVSFFFVCIFPNVKGAPCKTSHSVAPRFVPSQVEKLVSDFRKNGEEGFDVVIKPPGSSSS